MSKKNIVPFNQLAHDYDQWFDQHQAIFKSEVEALRKVMPKSGEGLEIGVGSGRFAEVLGIKTGIEPAENLGKIAKSRGINLYNAVAESLPFSDNQFDYVLFNTVVCFLDSPQRAFSEAKRVLKSNGVIIIGMIDKNSPLGRLYETKKMDNPFYKNAHFYSVDEMIAFINQLGFSQKEIYQTFFFPLDKIVAPDPVKPGYGMGGFVAIKAVNENSGFDSSAT